MESVDNKTIARNFMWYSIGSIIYMFGMWVITYLVVIISGPADAGLLALVISSTNVFYTISVWGMRTYQVSDLQGKFADTTYIISRFITCGFSMLACTVFVFVKGFTVVQIYCILLYMVLKISEALADVYNGIVQRHWRMDIIGKSYIVRAILMVAAFSLVLELTSSLLLAIVAMMICSFAVIISYDILQTVKIAHVKIKFAFQGIDKLLITCAPLIICSFLYSFNMLIPRLFLEDIYGTEVLGYYSAIAAPVLIIQLLASFIYAPLIPLFSKSHTEKNTRVFARLLAKTSLIILALSVVSIIGCYIFGDWGLSILFSSKKGVLEYSYLLIPTVLTVICTAYIWLLNGIITAIRQIKFLLISAIIGSVICVVISKYCIESYGANGINVAAIIVQMVQIILLLVYLIKYIFKGRAVNSINKTI